MNSIEPGLPASSGHAFEHALVVANPYSGNSKRRLDGLEALSRVAPLGGHAELGWTKGPGHATELAAGWAAAGHDLVVAVGGDGTVHEVARGLVGTSCAMAVLPSGSGNDFAGGVGCGTVADGLATLAEGRDVQIDVCALNDLVFVNSCGLFASGLVSGVAAGYWRWLGSARYTLAALGTLLTYRGQDVTWTLDSGEGQPPTIWSQKVLLAEICNGPLTGGGFRFAPDANLSDGLLDAALIKPLSPWAGLKLLPQASSGQRLDHPAIAVHRGRRIGFEAEQPVAYHLDGEATVLPAGAHEIRVLDEKLLVRTMQDL
ncbi:MAG: diacylglycerol kinase family protein [Candidatus Krumholzibacteria bacterium]|nr:diacylglycerol kinase family protein [Candidatus Krumholzibacteria bacterium]